ncbi:hypothetical protein DW083_06505 [Parabacteroides sp. AF48-14]|nr:hypothetical protein DW083_06505 [Parabacteroides sp. AF48-14]
MIRSFDMGNWERKQERKIDERDRKKSVREIISKYFLDLSKLFLTAVSFAALSPMITGSDAHVNWMIVVIGFIVSFIFAISGYRILK